MIIGTVQVVMLCSLNFVSELYQFNGKLKARVCLWYQCCCLLAVQQIKEVPHAEARGTVEQSVSN